MKSLVEAKLTWCFHEVAGLRENTPSGLSNSAPQINGLLSIAYKELLLNVNNSIPDFCSAAV